MHRVLEGLPEEVISVGGQTAVIKNALLFCIDEGLFLHGGLEVCQGSKSPGNRVGYTLELNLLFAFGATHEGKGDTEGGPLVLEEFDHATCVEHVATS